MYQIIYKKAALKALRSLPSKLRGRFEEAFRLLAEDPYRRDLDVAPLGGRSGYRLRIGSRRAIYEVKDEELAVLVLDIGARGDVYK